MDSSVLPLTTERGYLYMMARHCLPSRPHRPTSCQYEEMSCGGPQWMTISTFWMSIPIPNATVATMHRNEELLSIARLIIRDWLSGSVFLWNISTNLLWTVLGSPSYAWWASSRFNQAYISLTMLMLLEEWREAGYTSVFRYETLFSLLSLTIITQLQRITTVQCRYKALNSPKYQKINYIHCIGRPSGRCVYFFCLFLIVSFSLVSVTIRCTTNHIVML